MTRTVARGSSGDVAVVALAAVLIAWYRLRFALPAPLGRHGLLHRRMRDWGGSSGRSLEAVASEPPEAAAPLARLFLRAVEHGPGARAGCVPRSLALVRLLRLHGLAAELRVGMRRSRRGFTGHAWVVHHGAVIAQSSGFVASFAPLELAAAAPIRLARAVS